MRLNAWLVLHDVKENDFAHKIGVHPSTVSKYLVHGVIPRPEVMREIFLVTRGQVQPNDFYNLSIKPKTGGHYAGNGNQHHDSE